MTPKLSSPKLLAGCSPVSGREVEADAQAEGEPCPSHAWHLGQQGTGCLLSCPGGRGNLFLQANLEPEV